MISVNQASSPQVLNNHISVQAADLYSSYCLQYLRRLLRNGKLEGVKIGQLWLVDMSALDLYIEQTQDAADQRFGSKKPIIIPNVQELEHKPVILLKIKQ